MRRSLKLETKIVKDYVMYLCGKVITVPEVTLTKSVFSGHWCMSHAEYMRIKALYRPKEK